MSEESTEETEEVTEPTEESTEETEVEVPDGADDPDAVRNAIKAERAAAKKANARARELEMKLKEEEDAKKPLSEQIAEVTRKAEEAEMRAKRFEVAAKVKLPLELALRLQGTTEDELERDAQSLLTLVGSQTTAPPAGADGGFRQTPPAEKDPNRDHNNLLLSIISPNRGSTAGHSLFSGLQPAPADAGE